METYIKPFFDNPLVPDLLSFIKQGVVITTPYLDAPHPQILYANAYLLEITGYSQEELLGASPRILQGEKTNRPMLKELKKALGQGLPFTGETTNYRKDGTTYVVELSINPIFNENGEIEYFMGIHKDITAEKEARVARLESEAYRLEVEAQKQVKETLAHFAFSLTQQLRDPLSVIRLNAEALQRYRYQFSREKYDAKLGAITGGVDYLVELLNDVAIVSNINLFEDEYTVAVKRTPLDACQLSHDIVHRLQEQFPERSDDFEFSCDRQCSDIYLDARLLRHIVSHLITNAVIYSETGTKIEISIKQTTTHILVIVADNGKGIAREDQTRLFEPFYRATNSNGTIGTGLGLTIVKNSVDALNGTLRLDSEEGKGTTVKVVLPAEGVPS